MASTFKTFVSDDIANTRTLLHESIPITGSIVNGTTYATNNNIKSYGHGMFQSVYDYPYTSSSANHIFDMTFGSVDETTFSNDANPYYTKRQNVYNQMAQVLVGHDVNGEIRKFDADGDLTSGRKYNTLLFFNFARLLGKDEIKKGTFSMTFGTTQAYATPFTATVVVSDTGAATDYKPNSPAGEYGILKVANGTGTPLDSAVVNANPDGIKCGLIYYQAGIAAIDVRILDAQNSATDGSDGYISTTSYLDSNNAAILNMMQSATTTTDEILAGYRHRIQNIQFSNTTELNSTIYFCRIGHNDFNYSSNPTYLENSKIRVKDKSTDAPVSYITTVGLYSSDNEMLAVAKLSEPLRKDPTNDMTLRVRLDY